MRYSLSFTLIAALCTASFASGAEQTAYGDSEDVTMSGSYSVQGCGSNASSIAAILDLLPPYLEPAIADVKQRRTSPAYNTFFKDIAHAAFVRIILSSIAYGPPFLPGLVQPGFDKLASPVIACMPSPPISNPSPNLVGLTPWLQTAARETCNNNSDAYGVQTLGTNVVVLCPLWFSSDIPVKPKYRKPCIGVDGQSNQFRGLGFPLSLNRRAWLVHELAHMYIVAAVDKPVPLEEVYAINDCFNLHADEQRHMPENYVFYAGSMSLSLRIQYSRAHIAPTLFCIAGLISQI